MNVLYSRTKVRGANHRPDVRILNPRFFTEIDQAATKVFLNGDLPDVQAAYGAAGVPVEPFTSISAIPVLNPPAKPKGK